MALIVVIEESPLMRPAVRDLLQLEGHTVLTSGSAQEALGLLENIFGVDLVIANTGLPEMDGPVLVEARTCEDGVSGGADFDVGFQRGPAGCAARGGCWGERLFGAPDYGGRLTGAVRRMLGVPEMV